MGLARPTPLSSGTSILSPPGRSSPHTSRLAPPSSPVKRIPALSLQSRKSFPRQSTLDGAPPSPSVPSARTTVPSVPPPPSSPSHETSITVSTSRATVLPSAPQNSSPQPQLRSLHPSPVPEPISLPPSQITPSSSSTSASVHAPASLAPGTGRIRAVLMSREPSSLSATVRLDFVRYSLLLTKQHSAQQKMQNSRNFVRGLG